MEDFSLFLPLPQLDEQLYQLEPLPCGEPSLAEGYSDILQNLVGHSNEYRETINTDGFIYSYNNVKVEQSGGCQEKTLEKKDQNHKKEKVRRGRGRPAVRKSWMEKRDEANTRERRRMRDLVRCKQKPVKLDFSLDM